jgi:riboflavin kinase/FMN adenylyltransferase
MEVIAIPKERMEAEPISATRIRELLLLGHIRRANALLGYEYWLKGEISKGLGRAGALLDTPTVNLEPCDPHKLVPTDGIYAVRFGTDRGPGVCYIGSSPTFGDSARKIEVHLLEGPPEKRETSIVYFVEKLRPDMKFDSLAALRKQVSQDVAQARRVL